MKVINLNKLSVLLKYFIRAPLFCFVCLLLESCNPGEPGKLPILGFKDAVENIDGEQLLEIFKRAKQARDKFTYSREQIKTATE